MKKLGILLLSATLVMSSCTSSDQFGGAVGGGLIGGIFGSAIGGILGGHRGSDIGTVIGMVSGAAVGAAATDPELNEGRSRVYSTDEYNRRSNVGYSTHSEEAASINREYANLEIENLRFVDTNKSQSIDAGESCKIVFEVKNNGSAPVYSIAPVITSSEPKKIAISPTAVIGEIKPGEAVRYSAEVYAKTNLRNGVAEFTISFQKGTYRYNMTNFQLATRARR